MNNDSSPTSAAVLPPNSSRNSYSIPTASVQERQDGQTPVRKRVQAQTKKKYNFVHSLMGNLDVLIYAELSILYYMDCSFFCLILRALSQMIFLTPKPNLVAPASQHRPYIGAIFIPNLICLLLHIFTARSEADETMRGYLHGGIIVDLIGQKGPTSKLHLVVLDVFVTTLQCFMLTVHLEQERLAAVLASSVSTTSPNTGLREVPVFQQNHDAEERMVMRDSVMDNGDMEMLPLSTRNPSSVQDREVGMDTDQEQGRLLEEPPRRDDGEEDEYPLDMIWSGNATVADFHVLHTLRTQWDNYGTATSSALQTVGFSAEFAAVRANQRISAATQRFQRGVGSLSA